MAVFRGLYLTGMMFLSKSDCCNRFRGSFWKKKKKNCKKTQNWKSYSYLKMALRKKVHFSNPNPENSISLGQWHIKNRKKSFFFLLLIFHLHGLLFHVGSTSKWFGDGIRVLELVFCSSCIRITVKMNRIWKSTL